MYHAHDRAGRRPWRSLLCSAASLAALLFCFTTGPAVADCTTGGSSCTPGSGYTLDDTWDCGAIPVRTRCYFNGVTSAPSALSRYWGWGSAAYNGAGSAWVCINGGTYFYACATNLARACFDGTNCNAQRAASFVMYVENFAVDPHTIFGHGLA